MRTVVSNHDVPARSLIPREDLPPLSLNNQPSVQVTATSSRNIMSFMLHGAIPYVVCHVAVWELYIQGTTQERGLDSLQSC
jgi:hypothetical protein